MAPKYPKIRVRLTGRDGNAFAILGRVRQAMVKAGLPKSEVEAFVDEAMAGTYDHLLQTCLKWVSVS